jgi:hypothetical protein
LYRYIAATGFEKRDVSGGLQAEGDFSAATSTSRRGFGGRPPSRSTSPVTMSNAPAAKLAWMPVTMLMAPRRQPRLRQSGAQLLFGDDAERERPAGDFGDDARAFRTGQALGAGGVVDRACMAVADQDSGSGGRHVIARNESGPVLGQPGQHTLAQRRLRSCAKASA